MTPELFRLTAEFLDQYADRLGNDGCNDWEWPVYLSQEGRQVLVDQDYLKDFGNNPPPNWMVVQRLSVLLRKGGAHGQV